MKITIDRNSLLILSSETRIEILERLSERRRTLSELSKEIGISKSSVKEHLEKLERAGLVRRLEDGRKWIYYELTEEGLNIINPERAKKPPLELFTSLIAFIIGVITLIISYLELKGIQRTSQPPPSEAFDKTFRPETATTPSHTPTPSAIPSPTLPPEKTTTPPITPLKTPLSESAKGLISSEILFLVSIILIAFSFAMMLLYIKRRK